jgi:hypothetical protein
MFFDPIYVPPMYALIAVAHGTSTQNVSPHVPIWAEIVDMDRHIKVIKGIYRRWCAGLKIHIDCIAFAQSLAIEPCVLR